MMPDRQIGGIHQISEEEWPWDYLPPFLKDPTFVMSGDVVPRLLLGNLKLHCKDVIRPFVRQFSFRITLFLDTVDQLIKNTK